MAKSSISCFLILLIPLLLLLILNSGGNVQGEVAAAKNKNNNNRWCVAKPSSSDFELKTNIEYACNTIGDCKLIQSNGSCFFPNNLINHASVVMNQYYAMAGRNTWNCYFFDTGFIVNTDPSYGGCKYA